jgi:hypothetical protein
MPKKKKKKKEQNRREYSRQMKKGDPEDMQVCPTKCKTPGTRNSGKHARNGQ